MPLPVTLVGATQAVYLPSGAGTVAWPAGTAAGQLALVSIQGTEDTTRAPADTTGWVNVQHTPATDTWAKRVTATDLAGALPVIGYVAHLRTYSNAGRIGNVSSTGDKVTPGVRLTVAGALLDVFGRGYITPLTPTAGKLGADVACPAFHKRSSNIWSTASTVVGYKKLTGSFNGRYASSFEVLPLEGPRTPIPVAPLAGEVDRASTVIVEWAHQSAQGMPQQARQVRIRVAEPVGAWLYLQADGTIDTPPAPVATAAESASITAGELVVDTDYEWSVQTEDVDTWSAWSAPVRVTAATRPTVETVTVTAAAEDLSPTVTATVTTTGAVAATRIRLCPSTAATPDIPVVDSGTTAGASLVWTAPATAPWSNGQTLRAWVEVRQEGGLWSAPTADDASFAVTWTPPAAPTGVTATNPTSGPVVVTVTGVTGVRLEVEASTDAGLTWSAVSTSTPGGATSQVQMPQRYGIPVRFRARVATLSEGVLLWSAWTVSAGDITPTDQAAYLEDDGTWIQVRLRPVPGRDLQQQTAVSYPAGADYPTVDMMPAQGWTGQTVVQCATLTERDTLIQWLLDHPAFRIWSHPERSGQQLISEPAIRVGRTSVLNVTPVASGVAIRDVAIRWAQQP